jgi:WD40 repeat protein
MLQRNLILSATVSVAFLLVFCGNSGKSSDTSLASAESDDDSAVQPIGAIAYIRNNTEIRLIDSNGRNDRRLWTDTGISFEVGLHDLAWRPDGKELAFSSSHENLSSVYDMDLFAIRPDGSGYRKITNAPGRREFSKYKKGSVTVKISNMQYSYQETQLISGVFFVTMAGAEDPVEVTIPPGSSKTITFNSVADFGDKKAQSIVVISSHFRWYSLGTDVQAGKAIKAPDFTVSGAGFQLLGALRPSWKQDGSRIMYRSGECVIETVPSNPVIGELNYDFFFKNKKPSGACEFAYGPTPALADQVLYADNSEEGGSGIYMTKEGEDHDPSKRVTLFSDLQYQQLNDLVWMPDGSGFLYSTRDMYLQTANIFLYDFRTEKTRQITQLNGAFARKFTISPSGKWIVYERSDNNDEDKNVDLWMIGIDGKGDRLFVKNGFSPAWSK